MGKNFWETEKEYQRRQKKKAQAKRKENEKIWTTIIAILIFAYLFVNFPGIFWLLFILIIAERIHKYQRKKNRR